MLRLRVAKKLPWIDSKGEVRMPFEEFSALSAEARDALSSGAIQGLIPWDFGVLTDDWDAPESSKPTTVGNEDGRGSALTCFAVGSERAPDLYKELRPLWKAFFEWLLPEGRALALLLSDAVWNPEGHWVEIGPAMQAGLLHTPRLSLERIGPDGLHTTELTRRQLVEVTDSWWPSPVGRLECLSFDSAPVTGHTWPSPGVLSRDDLQFVSVYFRTSGAFDNLGFSVLSRAPSWETLCDRLGERGWVDGTPVELVLRTS